MAKIKKTQVSVNLNPAVYAQLKKMADKNGKSHSELAAEFIKEGLDREIQGRGK